MFRKGRILVGLVLVAGVALAISSFVPTAGRQPASADEVTPFSSDSRLVAEPNGSAHSALAARYHLRTRTERFFRRSTRAGQAVPVGGRRAGKHLRFRRCGPVPAKPSSEPAVHRVTAA